MFKLDLAKGYYQVEMAEKSKPLTTFSLPFGKYQFKRMLFGLKTAPAVFQKLMDTVLRPCSEFSFTYLDDLPVFSATTWVMFRQVLPALRSWIDSKSSKMPVG